MPELKVLKPNNPLLRKTCTTISLRELHTKKIQTQIEDLLDFVYQSSNKGANSDKRRPSTVGLSANQVGIDLAIAVVDLGIGHRSYNDLHVLINPKIVWSSKSITERDEGCVNLDHVRGFVKRSNRVKVEAYDRSGNKLTLDVHGWAAILMQHETDHLIGKLFIDKILDPTKAHLVKDGELVDYKKMKKSWDKSIDVSSLTKK